MNKLLLVLLAGVLAHAIEIPLDKVKMRAFGDKTKVNAHIIQLSSAQQSIMSLVSGHIEKYYVEPGQKVKAGQKIAQIDSIMLSKMTADYLSLKQQQKAIIKNFDASKRLFDKGMTSLQKLNEQSISKDMISAKVHALKSQLETLNIDTKKLRLASAEYTLYAHNDGTVNEVLQPLHSVIKEDTPIVSIIKNNAFFAKAFIPLRLASKLAIGQTGSIKLENETLKVKLTQILPSVDAKTQRVIAYFEIGKTKDTIFTNQFVPLTIYFDANKRYVSIQKSALSFFQNEWVVFVPKEEHEKRSEIKTRHKEHEEDEEEHEEAPYEPRVITIITEDDTFVAIKGLKEGELYVSGKSYFVKSLLLKSTLGEHGH